MYCGGKFLALILTWLLVDDVSSAVVDLGSYEFRAGYSGEDMPRSVIPSLCGHLEATEDVEMDNKSSTYISGYPELHFKREKMALSPLYQEDNTSKFNSGLTLCDSEFRCFGRANGQIYHQKPHVEPERHSIDLDGIQCAQ